MYHAISLLSFKDLPFLVLYFYNTYNTHKSITFKKGVFLINLKTFTSYQVLVLELYQEVVLELVLEQVVENTLLFFGLR